MAAKRGAVARAAPAAKKARVAVVIDPVAVKCGHVSDALRDSATLPQQVSEMLCGILPTSLAVPKAERHVYQEEAVEQVGLELGREEASLLQGFEEAEAAVAGLEEQKSAKEVAVVEARRELEVKQSATKEKKYALAEIHTAFKTAKARLEAAEEELRCGITAVKAAAVEKATLEAVLLKAPTLHTTPGELPAFAETLKRHLEIDASLLTAVPVAFSKAPEALGDFDKMAIQQTTEAVVRRVGKLEQTIELGEPARANSEAAVASAVSGLEGARERLRAGADAYSVSFDEETACDGTLKDAQKSLKELGLHLRKAAKTSAERKLELEGFRDVPLACFRELHELALPVVATEPESCTIAATEAEMPQQALAVAA